MPRLGRVHPLQKKQKMISKLKQQQYLKKYSINVIVDDDEFGNQYVIHSMCFREEYNILIKGFRVFSKP